MSFDTTLSICGPLRHPRQMLAEQEYGGHSSIHDDAMAEKLGFRAGPIEGIDWNSGAVYHSSVAGKFYSLVPGADYADTSVYAISAGSAEKVYDIAGWSLRLFELR